MILDIQLHELFPLFFCRRTIKEDLIIFVVGITFGFIAIIGLIMSLLEVI